MKIEGRLFFLSVRYEASFVSIVGGWGDDENSAWEGQLIRGERRRENHLKDVGVVVRADQRDQKNEEGGEKEGGDLRLPFFGLFVCVPIVVTGHFPPVLVSSWLPSFKKKWS